MVNKLVKLAHRGVASVENIAKPDHGQVLHGLNRVPQKACDVILRLQRLETASAKREHIVVGESGMELGNLHITCFRILSYSDAISNQICHLVLGDE